MAETHVHKSEWNFRQKVARTLWMFVQATLFRWSFHNWYAWRSFLLRTFGAQIGRNVRVRPTVRIEIPWHLSLADGVVIGDFAILYSLGPIKIGARSVVSQYSHLCAGSHDYTKRSFPLLCPPITIGADCWIATDVFVGPGVTVGDRAVAGARTTVVKDVPTEQVVVGPSARAVGTRPTMA